mmetsp:Transcript_27287/g.40304  ORF Transcript_27287/g.40304 Transcript_27287/m.40304 type:complete len:107 (+) Transcript_27287:1303-1623(+)
MLLTRYVRYIPTCDAQRGTSDSQDNLRQNEKGNGLDVLYPRVQQASACHNAQGQYQDSSVTSAPHVPSSKYWCEECTAQGKGCNGIALLDEPSSQFLNQWPERWEH